MLNEKENVKLIFLSNIICTTKLSSQICKLIQYSSKQIMAVDLVMHILQGILAQTKQNIENVSVVKKFLLCFLFQFQHSYFLLLLLYCRHATLCRVVTGLLYVNSIQHFACRVACLYK